MNHQLQRLKEEKKKKLLIFFFSLLIYIKTFIYNFSHYSIDVLAGWYHNNSTKVLLVSRVVLLEGF